MQTKSGKTTQEGNPPRRVTLLTGLPFLHVNKAFVPLKISYLETLNQYLNNNDHSIQFLKLSVQNTEEILGTDH